MNKSSYNNIFGQQSTEAGQVTFFFATTILFFVSCIAFVLSVGMFVKAKINLQNAVDAAAWSGAAVQARQLSNIAYLNWEMRNGYKEWMFKYYILGMAANPNTSEANISGSSMRFLMDDGFIDAQANADLYNIPSVCINFNNTSTNICKIYFVPGIPRFPPLGITGIDDTLTQFTNVVTEEKAKDCSFRAKLNFLTNLLWIYGAGPVTNASSSDINGAPHIAFDRPGAWVKNIEVALRIRNLEKIMNTPPMPNLCNQSSGGCTSITTLEQAAGSIPLNERSIKAFWSGYRNLANNDPNTDLKGSFKLTELSPIELQANTGNLNGLLNPANVSKYYVDLSLNLINYAAFYTLFMTYTDSFNNGQIQASAACAAIKTGLPVPAFPFGYTKNENFLTYYAVKGEVTYTGIFNPFEPSEVPLIAYAAAKPFGGRIGPMLFLGEAETSFTKARGGGAAYRSFPYITGIEPTATNINTVSDVMGQPLPLNIGQPFWANAAGGDPIGGEPTGAVFFGMPNLMYGLFNNLTSQAGGGVDGTILTIHSTDVSQEAGLYSTDQFRAVRNLLNPGGGPLPPNATLSSANYDAGIRGIRGPTLYESLNYLIPTNRGSTNTASTTPTFQGGRLSLFAPLWSNNAGTAPINETYYSQTDIINSIREYFLVSQPAIEKYSINLQSIATVVMTDGATAATQNGVSPDLYNDAAESLFFGNPSAPHCKSVAGRFHHFIYSGDCDPSSGDLPDTILKEWSSKGSNFATHYSDIYTPYLPRGETGRGIEDQKEIMTAYHPGINHGADNEGKLEHPFISGIDPVYSDRNYYSTKFISVASLINGGNSGIKDYSQDFNFYSEGSFGGPGDIKTVSFKNSLNNPTEVIDHVRPVRE